MNLKIVRNDQYRHTQQHEPRGQHQTQYFHTTREDFDHSSSFSATGKSIMLAKHGGLHDEEHVNRDPVRYIHGNALELGDTLHELAIHRLNLPVIRT